MNKKELYNITFEKTELIDFWALVDNLLHSKEKVSKEQKKLLRKLWKKLYFGM